MSREADHRHSTGIVAAVAALALWASGPLFIKGLTHAFDSWTQNLLRYGVAALVLLPFLARGILGRSLDRSLWKRAIVPALFNIIMQCLWVRAFYELNPGFAMLLSQTSSIWVAAISVAAFPEDRRMLARPLFWMGLLTALAGVAGVMWLRPDFAAAGVRQGIVLICVAAFFWALYTISIRVAFRNTPSHHSFAVIAVYTVIGLAVAWLFFSGPDGIHGAGVGAWAAIVVSGVACIACSHVLYYAAIKRVGPTIPAVVLLALPLAVLVLSALVFHERMRPGQWMFGIALVAGILLVTLARKQTTTGGP